MTWVRLDDSFPDHPKMEELLSTAGPAGAWMHVEALCWSAKHLTDGRLSEAKVMTFGRGGDPMFLAGELVRVKLWKRVRGGFLIHDFLDFQQSAKDVKAKRAQVTERKRRSRSGHAPVTRDKSVTERKVTRDKSVTLARVQPGAGSGSGEALLTIKEPTIDARLDEATEILSSVPRWKDVDRMGVENAALTEPNVDVVDAARLAATWGSDATWNQGPAASLRTALRKLRQEATAGRSKQQRGADGTRAIRALMGVES